MAIDLRGKKSIALDAMILIYYAEAHPEWGAFSRAILQCAEEGNKQLYISAIALTEVLTGYRKQKDRGAEEIFWNMLQALAPSLSIIPITIEVADRAATLRVKYGLRTPDALHIATAIAVGADAYITNDTKLKAVREIEVITLLELKKIL